MSPEVAGAPGPAHAACFQGWEPTPSFQRFLLSPGWPREDRRPGSPSLALQASPAPPSSVLSWLLQGIGQTRMKGQRHVPSDHAAGLCYQLCPAHRLRPAQESPSLLPTASPQPSSVNKQSALGAGPEPATR